MEHVSEAIIKLVKDHELIVDWSVEDYQGCECGKQFSWPDYQEKWQLHMAEQIQEYVNEVI